MAEELARDESSEGDSAGTEAVTGQEEQTGTVVSEPVSTLDYAITYARRGWRVFPVRGKLPLVMWAEEATTDEDKITVWWTQEHPDAGIGLVTGSGLVVLDVDAAHGGIDSMGALFAEYAGSLGDTPVVRTGGGGLHFYFSTPIELRNKTNVRKGIDIRGDGGYVVAPPSPHASGTPYAWEDSGPNDPMSDWPFDLHREEPAPVLPQGGDGILPGNRNAVLMSLAGSMRRRGMGELAIREGLLIENREKCNPPLPESEVIKIAKSAMRYNPSDPATSIEMETMAVDMIDFLAEKIEAPQWLVQGVWPTGAIGFIIGPPKVFKSFFALEMGLAIANGVPFLGMFDVPMERTVLLIQEESSRAAFKERVSRASNVYGRTRNFHVISNKPFNLEDKLGYERLKVDIAALRPSVLILDPLSSFVRGNQNDAQNMGDFIRSLVDLRNEFDLSIVIVHHSKKADPKEFRGSSALYAASEVTIRMRRFDEGVARSRVTFEMKDDEAPTPMDVQFQQATGILAPITQTQLFAIAMAAKARAKGEDDGPHYNK